METIFIQVAAYRDRELIPTVQDAIAQATHPELLSFGICWQYQGEEELQYIKPLKNLKNCRIDTISATQSRGTGWARARTQKLWRGEKYTLQIDSHIRFAPRWDTILIDMLTMCPSKKAILTAYPPDYEPPRTLLSNIPSRLVPAKFDQSGVLSLIPDGNLSEFSTPQPGAFIAAGFMFADASIIQQVPYDSNIYFYGEEVLFSARAWTRGWDIYHPHQVVCWHHYNDGGKRPVHWADHQNWRTFNGVSEQRFRQIMKMEPSSKNFGIYGLGKSRTLEEYESLAGVQFQGGKKDKALELLFYCVRPQMDSLVTEKILTLFQEEINWEYLFQVAANHRVMPFLYWSLQNMHPEVIPETVLTRLKNYFQSNKLLCI